MIHHNPLAYTYIHYPLATVPIFMSAWHGNLHVWNAMYIAS